VENCDYHVSAGAPAAAIAQYAQEQAVDQIVMCREGEGGLQSMLLGSEVGKLLHLSDCPVLLVK
jgi:nucleotide-binding universal stress UspA family protein